MTLRVALLLALSGVLMPAEPRPPDIHFRPRMIDPGASETAAVADVNRDGRLDIVSGESWYEAPGWAPHRFRELTGKWPPRHFDFDALARGARTRAPVPSGATAG